MQIWRKGHTKVNVHEDGCSIEIRDFPKLGVTEEEFDKIIESIDVKLREHCNLLQNV